MECFDANLIFTATTIKKILVKFFLLHSFVITFCEISNSLYRNSLHKTRDLIDLN